MAKAQVGWVSIVLALLVAACSPEATRQRGESGADIRNVDATIEMHGPIDMYHNTDVGQAIRVENRQ
jgi:hypothetical protein